MTRTLLLADDSDVILGLVERSLRGEDFEILSSDHGEKAMETVHSLRPDIVLASICLEGLNGYQLCARIKQSAELSSTPVVLLAGAFEPYDAAEAREAGADGHLLKPFEAEQLVECVRALVDRGLARSLDPLPDETHLHEVGREVRSSKRRGALGIPASETDLDLEDEDDLLDVLPLPKDDPALAEDDEDEFDFGGAAPPAPALDPEPAMPASLSETQLEPDAPPGEEIIEASPLPEEEPIAATPQLSRERVHEALKSATEETLGECPEGLVEKLIERIEAVAWEVIPEMAETLIREEIRRIKGDDQ